MQLLDEALGAHVDAGAHAHLLQEGHQAVVLAAVIVRQHLADIARIGEPLALRHAQEQPRQPVGEIAADEQQVIVLELVEQPLGHQVLALQRADELQQILIGDHVGRRCRELPEQVIDHRALQAIALSGQVGHPVGRIGHHIGRGHAAEALEVDRGLEQRIERGGDEQVEIGDRRQVPQRQRRLEVRILDDGAQAHVGFLAPPARRQEQAHHIVERVGLRQIRGGDVESRGELLGGPVKQQPWPALGGDQQQLRPHDGDDPPLLDEAQQIVPRVIVERAGRQYCSRSFAHGQNASPLWS